MTGAAARRAAAGLFLSLLFVTSGVGAESSPQDNTDPTAANEELRGITERLNALKAWFSDAEKKRNRWQAELQRADTEVAKLGLQVADLRTAQRAIEARIAELAERTETLEDQRQTQAERIGQHLNAAYRTSGQDFFKLLMNQQNPADLDRMVRYHQYFSEARSASLTQFQRTLAELAVTQQEAATERSRLVAQRAQVAERQREFEGQRKERETLLAELANETEDNAAERERLQRDRERLGRLLSEIAQRAEQKAERLDGREFQARKGSLSWPAEGEIQYRFGQARTEGRLRWQGTYIATELQAPVRAVHRGKVVFAEWLRGFGLLTIIDHGNNYMSLYGYADVLLKRPGDWVESGEPIANSGRSGGQTVNGVYFEIRHAGEPVDPALWLSASLQ